METTKHLQIFGSVQGVGYRAWTQFTAKNMNLTGWVRNRSDGTVEAVVTGPEKTVTNFVSACYQGPASANVENISVRDGVSEDLENFEIRNTL